MTDDQPMALQFSFAEFALHFDEHIRKSIRAYDDLISDCVSLSEYFIENETTALDIGCSTGTFLLKLREHNNERAPTARYVGVEIEEQFRNCWNVTPDVEFMLSDIRDYTLPQRCSYVTSIFSLQFISERERQNIVDRINKALVPGGALVLAEKTLSKCAKLQDLLTFIHFDFKRENFSDADILAKERSLRSMMKLWTEEKIVQSLVRAGFESSQIQCFWRSHSFAAFLALKT